MYFMRDSRRRVEHTADAVSWLSCSLRLCYYLVVLAPFHNDSNLVPTYRHRMRVRTKEAGLPTRREEAPGWHRVWAAALDLAA